MGDLGRMLVFVGGLLLVVGIVLILAGKVNLPIGRLPGDIVYRGKNTTFYFPLMTSILLSVILSLVLYVVNRIGGEAAVRLLAVSSSANLQPGGFHRPAKRTKGVQQSSKADGRIAKG